MMPPASSGDSLFHRIRALEGKRDALTREIERLQALAHTGAAAHREPVPARPNSLKGLKLAVIGPSFREQAYRQVLEPLGGNILFAASETKISLVYKACIKSHGIIYITSFSSHAVDNQVSAAVDRLGMPLIRMGNRGLQRMKEAALSLSPDMIAFRDLLHEARGQKKAEGPA